MILLFKSISYSSISLEVDTIEKIDTQNLELDTMNLEMDTSNLERVQSSYSSYWKY